jgi:hypothetical protein
MAQVSSLLLVSAILIGLCTLVDAHVVSSCQGFPPKVILMRCAVTLASGLVKCASLAPLGWRSVPNTISAVHSAKCFNQTGQEGLSAMVRLAECGMTLMGVSGVFSIALAVVVYWRHYIVENVKYLDFFLRFFFYLLVNP